MNSFTKQSSNSLSMITKMVDVKFVGNMAKGRISKQR